MKRKLPALFAALLLTFTLAGCQQAEENPSSSDSSSASVSENESASTPESSEPSASSEPEKTYNSPVLSLDDYPTVDGSTANIPLMALVMERAAGPKRPSPRAPPAPAPPPRPGGTFQTAMPTCCWSTRPPIRSRRNWNSAPSWK